MGGGFSLRYGSGMLPPSTLTHIRVREALRKTLRKKRERVNLFVAILSFYDRMRLYVQVCAASVIRQFFIKDPIEERNNEEIIIHARLSGSPCDKNGGSYYWEHCNTQ